MREGYILMIERNPMVLPVLQMRTAMGRKLPKASDDLGTSIQLSRFCCNALTQSSIIMLRFIPLMRNFSSRVLYFQGLKIIYKMCHSQTFWCQPKAGNRSDKKVPWLNGTIIKQSIRKNHRSVFCFWVLPLFWLITHLNSLSFRC